MRNFLSVLGVIFGILLSSSQSSSIGGERIKQFEFNPRFHSETPTEEASFFLHPDSKKLDICGSFNIIQTEPKPKRAVCNVNCDIIQKQVKCTLPELDIPECEDYVAYVYSRLVANYELVQRQMDFACEVQTKREHAKKVRLAAPLSQEIKQSPLCDSYRKESPVSAYEFPCYVKCDTFVVGVSVDQKKPDWELTCELYQHACTLPTTKKSMSIGNVCEAYRHYVRTKVQLGEVGFHHCDVYNHGPLFDHFNRTKAN